MKRATSIAVVACLSILVGLAVATIQLVRSERASAVDVYAAERQRAVDAVAREMDKDFENIGEVLRFAGQLFEGAGSGGDRERELRALVTVLEQYLAVVVYDREGRRILEATAPDRPQRSPTLDDEIDAVARRALVLPAGRMEASSPFTIDGAAWYRVFASPFASGVVAVLVDTQPLFGKVRLIAEEPESRLLVLGAHGLPVPVSASALARAAAAPAAGAPSFARLLEGMRAGGRGTIRIDETEARRLGLPGADVVAAYAPVPFPGGHWSVATLSSTEPLRDHDRAIVVRLALTGGAVAVCLVAFAVYAVLATRRTIVLRERLRHAARLAHLHEMTEKILDNIPSGVLALASDRRVTSVNRALRERLPAGAQVGELEHAFPETSAEVVGRVRALVNDALEAAHVRSIYGARVRLFGTDGQYTLHAVPLEPRFPEARVLVVIEDLSEVQTLESRLLRAEKLATVGILAAGIAHEIGTPLGVVRGRSEYILGKLAPDSPHRPGMGVIIDEIDRVSRTIRQLLDFARVKPALPRACELEPVARTVAELLRFEAERRKVTISIAIDANLPPVGADPDQLQQVLVNVVMNACDACAPGGRVAISALATDAVVRMNIEDDGCGIPLEHRHQVFDPFFTTKKRGQGTGLGLAIAAQIVRNHGGEIELDSEVDRGTRVSVTWPRARAEREVQGGVAC
jgi:signal transduction histidine kinase